MFVLFCLFCLFCFEISLAALDELRTIASSLSLSLSGGKDFKMSGVHSHRGGISARAGDVERMAHRLKLLKFGTAQW